MADKGELPAGYLRCKYLESNGKQFIFINLITKRGVSKTVAKIQFTYFLGRQLLGADYGFYFGCNEGYYDIGPRNISTYSVSRSAFDTVIHESNTYESWRRLSVNGSGFYYRKQNNDWRYGNKYCIFSVSGQYTVHAKLKSIYYTNNDIVVGNFIPALDSAGTPCMYDTISGHPFYNDGTGELGYELIDGTYVAPV